MSPPILSRRTLLGAAAASLVAHPAFAAAKAKLRIGLPAGLARQGVKIKEFAVEQIVGPAPFQGFDVVIEGANGLWPQLGGAGRRSERAGQEPRDER